VELELYDGMASLPHFNPDDDPVEGEPPSSVAAFRRELAAADAILFSTPEYAGALPGPLVNLLDWTVGGGETYGMPVGFVNAAGRAAPTAGKNAHDSLRTILGYTGSRMVETACRRAPVARGDVGADGLIADPGIRGEITAALDALAAQ
jgi:chromate reductase